MERLRAKSVQLSYFLEQLLRPLQEQVHLITPRDKARRGCQLSLRIEGGAGRGARVFAALAARGMVCDWRSPDIIRDRKSTRLNSSHLVISYAVFCLKKKET